MKKSNLIYILFFLVVSCSSFSKIYVSDVNKISSLENYSLIYSLPHTVLKISVKVQNNRFIPGPYHAYADKYLSIKDVKGEASELWTIREIIVDNYTEPDPDVIYAIKWGNKHEAFEKNMHHLEKKGFILPLDNFISSDPIHKLIEIPLESIPFTDLSIKRNLQIEKETIYKRVLRDSIYVQIPEEKEEKKIKSVEVKAEEAANFIIKLRKRKFKMLTGQNDSTPVDTGMEAAISELNRIEKEYLSLFIGKTIMEEFTKTYEYIPSGNKESEQTVLFRISENEGIIDAQFPKGRQVLLELYKLNLTKNIEKFNLTENIINSENTIVYRIPETTSFFIKEGDKVLLNGKTSIFQKGVLVGLKSN